MIRRAAALLVLAAAWLTLTHVAEAETHGATIASFNYTPSDVQINAGDTVVWRNVDPTVHTVTASRGEFGSGSMRQGQTFAVQFNAPGVYPYFCEPHEFMRGTVSVFGPGATTGPTTTLATTSTTGVATAGATTFVVNAPTTTTEVPTITTTTLAPRFVVGDVRGASDEPSPAAPIFATVAGAAAVVAIFARRRADAFRYLAIAATLATGALHLQLRLVLDYPEPIGTLLVIEAGGAAVLAAWLAAGPLTVRKGAVASAAHLAALAALGVTRTSLGLFGFHERGWDPSPQVPLALTIGVVAIGALCLGTVLRSLHASAVE